MTSGSSEVIGSIANDPTESIWRIQVQPLLHPNLQANAQALLANAQQLGIREAQLVRYDGRPTIVAGAFRDPTVPEATRLLERVRDIERNGRRVYPLARLLPPSDEMLRGRTQALDLRAARDRVGDNALYTIQVSVYRNTDGVYPSPGRLASFRARAEAEAARRRDAGEEAYFVHGPDFSSVTIGIFGLLDYNPQGVPPRVAPAIRAMGQTYPLLIENGEPSTQNEGVSLVAIPGTE